MLYIKQRRTDMGSRTQTHVVRTYQEATDIAQDRGVSGYSETYVQSGPIEVNLTDGTKGWKVITKTYYG